MKVHNLFLTGALALATSYGLAQTQNPSGNPPMSEQPSTQQPSTTTPDQTAPSTTQQPSSTSPDQTQAKTGSSAQVSDDTLVQEVKQKLSTDANLSNINVEAKNGVVILSGTVSSKDARKQAKELAKTVPGVRKVKEKISVSSTSSSSTNMGPGSRETQNNNAGSIAGNTSQQTGVAAGSAAGGNASSTQTESAPSASTATSQNGTSASTSAGSASGNMNGTMQPSTAVSSPQLQSQVQNALQQEPTLANSTIIVAVTDDAVDLSGNVNAAKDKQTAERIAQSYAGNRRVTDHLNVAGNGANAGAQVPSTSNPPNSTPSSTSNPPSSNPGQADNPNASPHGSPSGDVPQSTPPTVQPQQGTTPPQH